jgi:hypothetical protein
MSLNSTIVTGAFGLPSVSPFCGMPVSSVEADRAVGACVLDPPPLETAIRIATIAAALRQAPAPLRRGGVPALGLDPRLAGGALTFLSAGHDLNVSTQAGWF